MTCFPPKLPRAITIPNSKRVAIIIIFLYKSILTFKIQSDQNIHQNVRLAPMWQQSGTLLFCSCHGIAGFLVDELQI